MKQLKILHYRITGNGQTVVLLHGYMASSRYWDKTVERLALTHRVIAIDLLGFGRSPKPTTSRYDLEAQRRSLTATLTDIGVTEPFTLMGHSMGSLIALHYARYEPAMVRKLVLANMPVFTSATEAKADIYGTRLLYRYALKPGLHGIIWPFFKTILVLKMLPERITGDIKSHRQYMFQSNTFARVRSMRNLIFKAKVEADLQALTVKTVIISGISDRVVYLSNLQQFKLGDYISQLIVEGGHHLPQTNPQLIAELA